MSTADKPRPKPVALEQGGHRLRLPQMAIALGCLAGLAALGYMAFGLLSLLRKHYRAGRLLGIGCGVATVAFFVHGLLDYFLEFTPLFGLFWVLLGLARASEPAVPSP